jgi:hypothetical protein
MQKDLRKRLREITYVLHSQLKGQRRRLILRQHHACHYYLFIIDYAVLFIYLFLLFIIHLSIHSVMIAAAVCERHPAAA